jgi:hypothetical protein
MSLVQLIKDRLTEAIVKVSCENPALNREGEWSAEEARDSFIALLMAELFPVHGNEAAAVVEVPVVEPEPVAVPAKKLTKEEKAAEKAAKEAEKAAKAAEKEAAKAAKEAEKAAKAEAKAAKAASPKKSPEEKAAEKEAAAKAKAEAKAAEKAAKDAEKAAAKEAEKKAKEEAKAAEKAAKAAEKAAKKSPKAAEVALPASPKAAAANVPKIDPTWRKLLKEADKEHAKELEPELLKYLNGISNAVFNDKPARQHVAEFLEARKPVAQPEPAGPIDLEVVEFNGQDYYVNRETKRVYEGVMDDSGDLKVTRPVGYVGMADFKDMVLDEEDE